MEQKHNRMLSFVVWSDIILSIILFLIYISLLLFAILKVESSLSNKIFAIMILSIVFLLPAKLLFTSGIVLHRDNIERKDGFYSG